MEAPAETAMPPALGYAGRLLADLGEPPPGPAPGAPSALADWADSGAMALTGPADGAPSPAPAALAAAARGALLALERLVGQPVPLRGPALLAERAALLGLRRGGSRSAGGGARMWRTADGWMALQLARPDDRALLPAWTEQPLSPDDDGALARALRTRPGAHWIERAGWLGLAAAEVVAPAPRPAPWLRVVRHGPPRSGRPAGARPRVLDLSSLWAGPLCGRILAALGAEVIKLESRERPDGARGEPRFFDRMNAGKQSVALDLPREVGLLARLIASSDIVIESTRPRALRHWGIDAAACVREVPGLTWVGISGHGRGPGEEHRVAFGDDAAVAAGLARVASQGREPPVFCADAVADPLTGLHAALAAWAGWRSGGGTLLDLSLAAVAGHALLAAPGDAARPAPVCCGPGGYRVHAPEGWLPVRAPADEGCEDAPGRRLGADTARVLAGLPRAVARSC